MVHTGINHPKICHIVTGSNPTAATQKQDYNLCFIPDISAVPRSENTGTLSLPFLIYTQLLQVILTRDLLLLCFFLIVQL